MMVIVVLIFGLLLGGWISDNYMWLWIFYINLLIGVFLVICVYFLLCGCEMKMLKQWIDVIGFVLFVIGVLCLQMMFDFGKDCDWFNLLFIVVFVLIVVVLFVFMFVWEVIEKELVVDLLLFKDCNFVFGVLIILFGFMVFFGLVVIFLLWLQMVMGYMVGKVGFVIVLVGLFVLVLLLLIGCNMYWFDLWMVVSFVFIVFVGVLLWNVMFMFDVLFNYVILLWFVQGIGVVCFFVLMMMIMLLSIFDEWFVSVLGLLNFLCMLFGVIGIVVSLMFWENDVIYYYVWLLELVSVYVQNMIDYQGVFVQFGIVGQMVNV